MPLIKDIMKETELKKKFQRKAYRPWDEDMSPSNETLEVANSSIDPQLNLENLSSTHEIHTSNFVPVQLAPENSDILPDKLISAIEELNLEKSLRDLYGGQRIVFKFLISLQMEELDSVFITQPIATSEIALSTKLPLNTITTVINRLKLKKLLQTYESKPGRGGYARYNFTDQIYKFFSKKLLEN